MNLGYEFRGFRREKHANWPTSGEFWINLDDFASKWPKLSSYGIHTEIRGHVGHFDTCAYSMWPEVVVSPALISQLRLKNISMHMKIHVTEHVACESVDSLLCAQSWHIFFSSCSVSTSVPILFIQSNKYTIHSENRFWSFDYLRHHEPYH